MDRYAVMGNPVAHSKSPQIHRAFADQTGERLSYDAIQVESAFPTAVARFFEGGGKGLNVTVPWKQEAWRIAGAHSRDAEIAGAVNTLFRDEKGVLQGHNTDGIGLMHDIKTNHNGVLSGKSVLVLGAGGACRGILRPLLGENPAQITIANRTVRRAQELAELFAGIGEIGVCEYLELQGRRFDWVINATSASLSGELLPLPDGLLSRSAWCYDLAYGSEPTVFCRWAKDAGAGTVLDGLGMLVEQAAESFSLWRGVRPDTAPVIASLRGS